MLNLLFGQDGCEVFHLKDLADFDFVVAGAAVGTTLDPLDGLLEGLDLRIEKPAMSSLASVKGPSTTVRDLPENLTRAPLELGWSPSRASRTPALHELFVVLAHLGQELWIGEGAFFFCLRGCFDDDHESHCKSPLGELVGSLVCRLRALVWIAVARFRTGSLLIRRTGWGRIDMRTKFKSIGRCRDCIPITVHSCCGH